MHKSRVNKFVLIAVMTSVGIMLQIFESQIPIPISLPGGKIGLANITGLVLIPTIGPAYALTVSILRAVLGSLLYGGMVNAAYSVSGAVLSTFAMILSYKFLYPKTTFIGIGVLGAVSHNTAQILVAAAIMGNKGIIAYLPVLIIIAVFSGSFTGLVASLILRGSGKWLKEYEVY